MSLLTCTLSFETPSSAPWKWSVEGICDSLAAWFWKARSNNTGKYILHPLNKQFGHRGLYAYTSIGIIRVCVAYRLYQTKRKSPLKQCPLYWKMSELNVFFHDQMPIPRPPKQKNRAGEIGAQGAYFLPTVSRLVAKGNIEKSSTVVNHVPSLQTQSGISRFCSSVTEWTVHTQPYVTCAVVVLGFWLYSSGTDNYKSL